MRAGRPASSRNGKSGTGWPTERNATDPALRARGDDDRAPRPGPDGPRAGRPAPVRPCRHGAAGIRLPSGARRQSTSPSPSSATSWRAPASFDPASSRSPPASRRLRWPFCVALPFVASWVGTRTFVGFSTWSRRSCRSRMRPRPSDSPSSSPPAGFLLRLVSPWLTGFARPPDWLIVHDPLGLTMIAGLVVKEVPFLFLVMLAAFRRSALPRRGVSRPPWATGASPASSMRLRRPSMARCGWPSMPSSPMQAPSSTSRQSSVRRCRPRCPSACWAGWAIRI